MEPEEPFQLDVDLLAQGQTCRSGGTFRHDIRPFIPVLENEGDSDLYSLELVLFWLRGTFHLRLHRSSGWGSVYESRVRDTRITSIDGVGAYDLISRNAMLEFLLQMDGWDHTIPFVRIFYGGPFTHLWEDEMGTIQYIPQGEGVEQGDPLCQCSAHWGQHGSLVATQEQMIGNEKVFAFLDDVYLAERTWEGGAGAVHCQRRTSHPEPTSKCTMAKPRFEIDQG